MATLEYTDASGIPHHDIVEITTIPPRLHANHPGEELSVKLADGKSLTIISEEDRRKFLLVNAAFKLVRDDVTGKGADLEAAKDTLERNRKKLPVAVAPLG